MPLSAVELVILGIRGLSFHRIPKFGKNKETEEWRQRLIHAVNRVDCPAYRLHCSPMKNAQTFDLIF